MFHCVHFECPANRSFLTEYLSHNNESASTSSSTTQPLRQPPTPPRLDVAPQLPQQVPQQLPLAAAVLPNTPSNDGDSNSSCSSVSHPTSQQQTSRHSADIALSKIMSAGTFNICRSALPTNSTEQSLGGACSRVQYDDDNDNALEAIDLDLLRSNSARNMPSMSSYAYGRSGTSPQEPMPSTSQSYQSSSSKDEMNSAAGSQHHSTSSQQHSATLLNRMAESASVTNGNEPETEPSHQNTDDQYGLAQADNSSRSRSPGPGAGSSSSGSGRNQVGASG